MALVLAVGGVTDLLGESVIGVLESAHHRRVDADIESFQPIRISRGIQEQIEGFGIGALGLGASDNGAICFGDDAQRVRGIIHEAGRAAGQLGIKFESESGAVRKRGGNRFPFWQILERFHGETSEELGVNLIHERDHLADHGAGFAWGIGSGAHTPEAVQDDAGKGVDHGREGGDGENIASDFDGALFGGALDFLDALRMGHGTDVPDVLENGAGFRNEERGEFAIVRPGAGDRLFIGGAAEFVKEERERRNVSLDAVHANVALALLLGIVERMSVKKGPDELAADVFEAEFKVGVLENGVMTAVEGGSADVDALLFGDFSGGDKGGGIAGAGGGDG